MHFICYYYDKDKTKSTYYTDCATRLKNQLESYGHKTSFDYINFKERGLNDSYSRLNMIKPQYVLEKMQELNDSVVWIDADCVVLQSLEEFEKLQNYDFAYCVRHHDNRTPHAAVLYFNNTESSKNFLNSWKLINEEKVKDDSYDCTEHCTLIDEWDKLNQKEKDQGVQLLKQKEFRNMAYSGVYDYYKNISKQQNSSIKIWIGISPDAWEYERLRNKQ